MKTFVTIRPTSQRAKNRVREHGTIMILVKGTPNVTSVLVESRNKTFKAITGIMEEWSGWFSPDEAQISVFE